MKAHKYFLSFEKKAHELTINNYYKNYHADFFKLIISNIMWNAKRHIVSVFKDYLIFDELAEFVISFYPCNKSYKKLNELFNYYEESSFIFPNYTPLPESKYIYRSIIKKQRVIDEQENLEELKIKQKKLSQKQKNIFYDFYHDSGSESKFFNSNVYNSILKPSESLIKILFGIDNKTKKDIDYLNKNFINSSNSINSDNEESYIGNYYIDENEDMYLNDKIQGNKDYYDEDIDDIKNIIKNIYQIEKKKNANITVKDIFKNNHNNNSSKIKIKLGLLPNNENNYNKFYIVNRTGIGKIQRNILNGIKKNNFFKKYDSGNNSRINQNKVNLYLLNNNNKINNISIKNRTKTKYDLQDNIMNNEISNPLVITNYTLKKNNNSLIKTTINSIPKNKKVRSTYFFNDSSINYTSNNNHNNSNNKNSLMKLKNNNANDTHYLYRNEYNTPIQKRTKTLDRNVNKINIKNNNNNQYKKNDSIININININETNLYVNNTNKTNFYKKNDYYPKIIPKLDFNSMTKMNNTYKQSLSKEKEKQHSNSIKNKNYKNTLCLNDLKNIYKNNNFTERNLIKNKETSGKRIGKINEKFKLMLGLPTSNKKIQFRRKDNDSDRNFLYFTESNHTLKINNINNTNNHFNKKNLNNNAIKYNNSIDKNKVVLTESLTKIKI
jgi:hypothetical protein